MSSQDFLLYVLKISLLSGIFLGYYWLALRNKRLHVYNRFYLLSSMLLSLVLPLVHLNWETAETPVFIGSAENIDLMIKGPKQAFHWISIDMIGLVIFLLVSLFLFGTILYQLIKIYQIKRTSDIKPLDGFDLILTEDDAAPFSFFNTLFWKKSISMEEESGKQIFQHELTHIQQKHTLDKLFMQCCCAVFWMNPFYWLIQKELEAIHEFLADESAVGAHNSEGFAKMLLQAHYGHHFFETKHSFFYSSIKRRLTMLTTTSNIRFSYARRVMLLPLMLIAISIFSVRVQAKNPLEQVGSQPPASSKPTNPSAKPESYDKVFTVAQKPASFPGGASEWRKYLERNLNRDLPVKNGAGPGKYVVNLSFLVDKNGAISKVKIINDPGYGAGEEAKRMIELGPKWIPAKQNGHEVNFLTKQSITFVVSAE